MSKYKFNKDQLKFDEERRGIFSRISRAFKYIIGSVLLAVLYYIIFALLFDTREEERLINENRMLSVENSRSIDRFGLVDSVITELSERDENIYKSLFKTAPPKIGHNYRSELYYQLDTSSDKSIIDVASAKIFSLDTMVSNTSEKLKMIFATVNAGKEDNLSMIPSIMPIKSESVSQTGAGFGKKMHPFYKTMNDHQGIDLLAPIGTEVISTVDGTIKDVIKSNRGKGNQVVVTNEKKYTLYYAYLGEVLVRKGQKINRGTVIARVGNTGLSLAPHLHYEVHYNDKPVDPVYYFFSELSPIDYMEIAVTALNNGQSLD